MGYRSSPEVDAALLPFLKGGTLAGAVAVVGNEREILAINSVGHADIENGVAMGPDALFWIASQTKPMTATALMMLVDEGKVRLDDPIEKHLPEFKGVMVAAEKSDERVVLKKPGVAVTVRHILSHTAGMAFSSLVEEPTLDGLPLWTAVKSYAMTPLNTEPGTAYAYANMGTNTAGRLIEVLSGMAYEDFLQQRLFDPLGMRDTTFFPTAQQVSRLATTYKVTEDKSGFAPSWVRQLRYPLEEKAGRYPMPAGGLFSTAEDCYRFCRMILGGGMFEGRRIVSEGSVGEMTHRQTPASVATSYGLCFSQEGEAVGHGGAYSTKMMIHPKRKLITVFLVQHDGWAKEGGGVYGAFEAAALRAFS